MPTVAGPGAAMLDGENIMNRLANLILRQGRPAPGATTARRQGKGAIARTDQISVTACQKNGTPADGSK